MSRSSNRKRLSKADKTKLIEMYGNRCRVCGTDENIEWHHIMPLCNGGEDTFENMQPLCHKCHVAIHTDTPRILIAIRHHNKGGRKPKIPFNYKETLQLYVNCTIGKKKCVELLGLNPTNHLTDNEWYKKFLEEKGIASFKNTIDLRQSKGVLKDGVPVGRIKYADGTEKTLYYDEGKDNAIQKPLTTDQLRDKTIVKLVRLAKEREREIKELKQELWLEKQKNQKYSQETF